MYVYAPVKFAIVNATEPLDCAGVSLQSTFFTFAPEAVIFTTRSTVCSPSIEHPLLSVALNL
ncbi:hypothetical protein D3C80_1147320 [compost metagenome]